MCTQECYKQSQKIQKSCCNCYHCIEIEGDEEKFCICGPHNMEIEQEYCGLFEVKHEQGI